MFAVRQKSRTPVGPEKGETSSLFYTTTLHIIYHPFDSRSGEVGSEVRGPRGATTTEYQQLVVQQ